LTLILLISKQICMCNRTAYSFCQGKQEYDKSSTILQFSRSVSSTEGSILHYLASCLWYDRPS